MFSKQTLSFVPQCLPKTHAELEQFMIYHDLDDKIKVDPGRNTLPKISNAIMNYLINNQDENDSFGNNICISVMTDIIHDLLIHDRFDEDVNEFKAMKDFYRYLRLDGYDIDFEKNELIASFPENIEINKKDDSIQNFLYDYGFSITKGHYDNAKSSYVNGNLAASCSQLRSFIESLLMDMANYIKDVEKNNQNLSNIKPEDAIRAMQVLAKCQSPILDKSLNEWMGDGKGYFEAFWKRLHPLGSHPGIPSLNELVYRYQLVIINSQQLIDRFKNSY